MRKRLVAFGCSLTYGDELSDCVNKTCGESLPSEYAWPSILAKDIDRECVNMGYMGASNSMIVRLVSRYLYDRNNLMEYDWINQPKRYAARVKEDDIVVIQWTAFDRMEFFDESIDTNKWSKYRQIHPHQMNNSTFGELYATIISYETSSVSYERAIQHMNMAAAMLKSAGLKFRFVYGITTPHYYLGEEKNISLMSVDAMNSVIDSNNMSFVHFSNVNNFAMGKNLHPLEEAHRSWAKIIKQDIV